MSCYSVWQVYRWYDSSNWVRVPGKVQSLELKVSSDGEGTSYRVICEYDYALNGKNYLGDRPSFYFGSDNLGSFQKNLHRRLKEAKKRGVVDVWVAPNDPANSVLDRTFRPGFFTFSLVFSLVFGSIGLGVLGYVIGSRSPRVQDGMLRLQSTHGPSKFSSSLLMLFYAPMTLMSFVVGGICLFNGQLSAIGVLMVACVFAAAFVFSVRVRRRNRHVGYVLLPTDQNSRNEPYIALPARWSGPVDLDLRWSIPRPPSNQVGVEDAEEADSFTIDLPSVQGTMNQTQIPFPLPDLAEINTGVMPIRLEVNGLIGGNPYEDVFEVPAEFTGDLKTG